MMFLGRQEQRSSHLTNALHLKSRVLQTLKWYSMENMEYEECEQECINVHGLIEVMLIQFLYAEEGLYDSEYEEDDDNEKFTMPQNPAGTERQHLRDY